MDLCKNIRRAAVPAVLLTAAALTAPVMAADAAAGKKLHAEHCTSCHDSSVYTREDRRIQSLDALRKQVKRCELSQGLRWFEQDIENVVAYLNQQHYHFE